MRRLALALGVGAAALALTACAPDESDVIEKDGEWGVIVDPATGTTFRCYYVNDGSYGSGMFCYEAGK